MRHARLFLSVSAGVLCTAATAHAQAPAQPAVVTEVVVTSSPVPVWINSATTHVEILNRQALDAAPPAGLGDMLASLPGLRSTAFGPGASRPVIRGLSGPRVLILQNGVGLVDASSLSPDHAVASDPGEAERIEVLRGPSTLAYGGSGIGGVVNVIDERVPTSGAADGVEARLAASYGSVDEQRAVSGGLKAGSGPWVVSADFTNRNSDSYEVPTPFGDTTVPNSDAALDAYGAGVSYVHDDGYLGVSVKRTESLYGVPFPEVRILGGPLPGGEGPVAIDLAQTRLDVRGEQALGLGLFDRLRVSIGHADYEHQEIERETGEIGTTFLSKGTEGRLELVQADRSGWRGAVGVQGLARDLEAIGEEAFIPPVRISEAAAFTLQRFEQENWGVEAGARLDRRRLKTPDDRRAFTNASFSAGAYLRPTPDWFLALSLSHNRRAPTEVELFADGPHAGTGAFEIGDPSLKPEQVNSAEATLRYARGPFHLEGHAFVARYDGFIDQLPTGAVEDDLPVFRYLQTDARFVGGEVEGSWTAWRSGSRSLALEAAADWVRGSSDLGPPARIPPRSLTGRLVYESDHIEATAEVRDVAGQDRVAAFETPTQGYTLVNLGLRFKPWTDRSVRLFVEARNVGNAQAREHVSFLKDIAPLAGRSVRVGFTSQF